MSGREYVRVYMEVVDDPKFADLSLDGFGGWLRLLLMADAAWPASAFLPGPGVVPQAIVDDLANRDIIDLLPGHRFRVHGLDKEREGRSSVASANATLRWSRPKQEGGKVASRSTRFKVLERDNYRCRYCGRTSGEVPLDVDHVVPVREGGTDSLDNLVAACVDCNAGKSGHPLTSIPSQDARALRAHSDSDARASDGRMLSRAKPSKAEPSSHAREREGLLNFREVIATAWEQATGRTVLASGNWAASYIDDAVARHGEHKVAAAVVAARHTFDHIPEPAALAAAVRHVLDPLPNARQTAEVDRKAEEAKVAAATARRNQATLLRARHNSGHHAEAPDTDCPACGLQTA